MPERRRRLLLHEFELQCDFALRAYQHAASAGRTEGSAFWYAVQGLVTAATQAIPLAEALGYSTGTLPRQELHAIRDVHAALEQWGNSRQPSKSMRSAGAERSLVTLFGYTIDLASLLGTLAELREKARAELRHLQELV
jgi:hypothetical protein